MKKTIPLLCFLLSGLLAGSQTDSLNNTSGIPSTNNSQKEPIRIVNGVPVYSNSYGNDPTMGPSPLVKDDYLVEISYGVPYAPLREANFFGISELSQASNSKTAKTTNHICGNVDYFLGGEYSVGLELTYASTEFSYQRNVAVNPRSIPIVYHDSTFSAKASKLRVIAKMSYHLNISERFDAFITGGFGYKSFTYQTNDGVLSTSSFANQIYPIAVRLSVGGRFFINNKTAVHVEGGLGGPMMQIGLSFKMHSYNVYQNTPTKAKDR